MFDVGFVAGLGTVLHQDISREQYVLHITDWLEGSFSPSYSSTQMNKVLGYATLGAVLP